MKKVEKKQKIFTSVLIIIILILMLELVLTKTANMRDNKQIIKEMTEGEYESKITELNASHTDYALQVQENKRKLATAISNQKVETSENATIDVMVTNIGKILEERTKDATATADNITQGKTAYINGKLITGTGMDNNSYYDLGKLDGSENSIAQVDVLKAIQVESMQSYTHTCTDEYKYYICIAGHEGSINLTGNGEIIFKSTKYYTGAWSNYELAFIKATAGDNINMTGWTIHVFGLK